MEDLEPDFEQREEQLEQAGREREQMESAESAAEERVAEDHGPSEATEAGKPAEVDEVHRAGYGRSLELSADEAAEIRNQEDTETRASSSDKMDDLYRRESEHITEKYFPEADGEEKQRLIDEGIEQIKPSEGAEIHGSPGLDAQNRRYQINNTCALMSEAGVLEKHTGEHLSEKELMQEAGDKGWAVLSNEEFKGTYPNSLGKLLEDRGLEVEKWNDGSADMDTLKSELDQGHDVIVVVNPEEFYGEEITKEGDVSHAVRVTGVETDPEGGTRVYVNDTMPDSPTIHDAKSFERAWEATYHHMVSTKEAASEH